MQRSRLKLYRGPVFASLTFLSALIGFGLSSSDASARTHHVNPHQRHASGHHSNVHHARYVRRHGTGHVIQCVAFAKTASDVVLRGNAADWWYNARGVYARGQAPEAGSVLNFRAIRRMPFGHVAVVREVENSRTIIIDQSHWGQRGISHNTRVIDVSPNNDWSAVRVALNGRTRDYGSIYPTYGFIYARADNGVMVANNNIDRPSKTEVDSRAVAAAWSHYDALRHPVSSTEVASAPASARTIEETIAAENR